MSTTPKGIEVDVGVFDDEEPLPIDTLGGIMQRISRTNARARKETGRARQCPSTFMSGRRSVSVIFCTLDEGHEGEHRGHRKRWPNKAITGPGGAAPDAKGGTRV